MAHQQEQGLRRRLLKHFQKRVRTLRMFELVGAVDDADPPAALPCRGTEKGGQPPHLLDRDDSAHLAGVADGALQNQEIWMGIDGDAAYGGMSRVERKRGAGWHPRRIRVGEDEPCDTVGERPLADTGLASDQPGMRDAAGPIGGKKPALGAVVTE